MVARNKISKEPLNNVKIKITKEKKKSLKPASYGIDVKNNKDEEKRRAGGWIQRDGGLSECKHSGE